MKYFKILQQKILLTELRVRHAFRTLKPGFKKLFLFLFVIFAISGILLLQEVDKKLSAEVPTEAGILKEGIIGTPRFVNPVLTISDADRDLTTLIYSGLMRAEESRLTLDLAESYKISEDGLCYTFTLKPDLLWSDDTPLTTEDIIFTIKKIQNPIVKSPKRAGWEGVEIEKIDDRNIKFCLEKPYAPFLENTIVGILPMHIWESILPEQMSLSIFNIEATGSGPYKIKDISRNSAGIITSYTLEPNKNFALQKSYIQKIILKFYPSEKELLKAYAKNEIDSLSAISPQNILDTKNEYSALKTYLLPRVFAVFLNQDNAPLFANLEVREALNLSTDRQKIVKEVLKDFGNPIYRPIPPGSLGYIEEPPIGENYEENLELAKEILNKSGWKLVPIEEKTEENTDKSESEEEEPEYIEEEPIEQILEKKKGKETIRFEFSISTSNIPELIQAAKLLKEDWEKLGAKVDIKIYEIGDLEQNVIRPREYDSLLFGEIVGRDPDAFAFWHSSQRNDPGLNISLYANIVVDKLLEDARGIFNMREREEKYKEFQEEVAEDIPAIFLYSPNFIYLIPQKLKGINEKSITISSERFSQVYKWYTQTKKVWKIFQ